MPNADAPDETPPKDVDDSGFPRIPGYRILSRIGAGSFADVYKAIQLKLQRTVALKVLPPILASEREALENLIREARAAARISHENIVAVYDVGVADQWAFFAMEFVDGNSLEKLIRRGGPMDERRALQIGLQVARALEHAWNFRIIHRDIKPSNILINRRSVVKLCDLGFARGVLSERDKENQGLTVGTPHYISPEQARGLSETDIRSDIYSLGATLYHAVTGKPPFTGDSIPEIMAKHVSEDPVPVNVLVEHLTPPTVHFISRMMAKDPARRYDPATLVKDLEANQSGEFRVPAGSFSDSSLALLAQENRGKKTRGRKSPSGRHVKKRTRKKRMGRKKRRS